MKIILYLILFSSTGNVNQYREIFGSDYDKAKTFNETNGTYFELVSKKFSTPHRFLKSIIFPELIRYSYFSDLMETGTLEWLYVEGGSRSADFSIGHFQMKPSFVEAIEGYVSSVEPLREEYGFIVLNGSGSSIRRQRVERMKKLGWQLIYLSCFVEIAQHKFANEVFPGEGERLRFFCAAYNAGFQHNALQLRKISRERSFPYGPKFGGEQYAYSDVAVTYFNSLP